jgi:hypothetical protein
MTKVGERYRLLEQVGNDVNSDGTPGAPLKPGSVGTVKRADRSTVILDFQVGEQGDEVWIAQTTRAVSFPAADLGLLFERVED